MKKYRPSKKQIKTTTTLGFRKRGVHPDQLAKKQKAAIPFPDYKTDIVTAPTSDKVGNGFVKSNKRYSGAGVHVGQAYNKGNLVVLLSKEASDSATGKRR